MTIFRRAIVISLALLFINLPASPAKPLPFDLGLSASAGYTALDFEAASGYSDDRMEDWDQFHYKFTIYGLHHLSPELSMGLELGYNYLYYYYYRVPYVPSPLHYEAWWATISYLGLVRFNLTDQVFLQAGAGIHSFIDDGTAPALSGAIGIKPRVNNLCVPVFFRVDPIFGDGHPVTFALGVGVEFFGNGAR